MPRTARRPGRKPAFSGDANVNRHPRDAGPGPTNQARRMVHGGGDRRRRYHHDPGSGPRKSPGSSSFARSCCPERSASCAGPTRRLRSAGSRSASSTARAAASTSASGTGSEKTSSSFDTSRTAKVGPRGHWQIENDQLVQTTLDSDAWIVFGDRNWTDYTFIADVKLEDSKATSGCISATRARCGETTTSSIPPDSAPTTRARSAVWSVVSSSPSRPDEIEMPY